MIRYFFIVWSISGMLTAENLTPLFVEEYPKDAKDSSAGTPQLPTEIVLLF